MKIEKANRAITRAWIATLILAILGLIATSRSQVEALFAFFITCGLAFGISKKSRICAVIMCFQIFFALQSLGYRIIPIPVCIMLVVFVYFIIQGTRGTFAYHKWLKEMQKNYETNYSS